jgi:diguanylate cyclase (GGDEF)-like protein
MRTYAWGVALTAWVLLLPALVLTPPPPPPLFAAFVLLAVAAEWLMVPLPRGGYQSAGLVVVAGAMLLLSPAHLALVMSLGVAVGNGVLHRRPSNTAVFNSGQYIIASFAAVIVFAAIDRSGAGFTGPLYAGRNDVSFLVAFFGGIIAYVLTSSVLVSQMVAYRKALPALSVFSANIGWELVNNTALATLGLVLTLIFVDALPVGAVILAAPLLVVGYVLMLYTTREQAHRELQIVERIGRASMTLDQEQLFQTMYGELRKVMSADAFYVAIADGQGQELTFEFLIDSGQRYPRQPCDRGERLSAILQRGEPVLINRTREELIQADAFVRVGREDRRSASLMFVPVKKASRSVGLVSVQSYTLFAYHEHDLRLLEAIASQAATAVENARLFEASRRNVERLTILQNLSTAIAGSLELDKVLPTIADGARQALRVDRCAIFLGDEHHGLLQGYAQGFPPEFIPTIGEIYRGPNTGPLPINVRQPGVLEDIQSDPAVAQMLRLLFKEAWPVLEPMLAGVRTIVNLPLLYRGDLLGVLVFYHDVVRPYPEDDLRLAEAIANQAAIAVKNATLLTQAQRRVAEVNLLNRLFSSVSGTLNLEELFRRTVEGVASQLGYSHVGIYRRDGDHLLLRAQIGYAHPRERIPLNECVIGRVARTAQPALLADVSKDPDYVAADPAVRSEAAVPIIIGSEVHGVLNIEAGAERILGKSDLQVLETVARQLSVALGNATLYDEVKRARDELSVLYEAAKAISSSLEMESVLETLVQVTCRAFGYEYGAILLVEERTGELVVEATHGYAPATRGYRVPSGRGITGWVRQTGKAEFVRDVRDDPRYIGVNPQAVAEIAVPLISEGRVIGVFNVESTRQAALGERDLNILTALAGYATIAIQNARLFAQTEQLATTDGLTGLFNHRHLHQAMERMLERCRREDRPLALIMLEIDNFKRYNDTYGHQRGDEVLRIVADLLRKGSRATDVVARYGGDEFMIVLPDTAKETAGDVGERLRRAIQAYPFHLGENIVTNVTLSVGVAATPDDGETVDALVDAVDRAQYSAKRSGGNKVQNAHVYH